MSSLAQQEVESLSKNVKMGLKMKMKRGEMIGFNGCLGYDYHPEDKSISVNEEEAEIIRFIYDMYLQGYGSNTIAKHLTQMGKRNKKGEVQKYFTEDYLSGKKVKNIGQRDRYYVLDSHPGIISKEKFLEVACEMNRRKNLTVNVDGKMIKMNRKYNPQNVLGNILECEECGATYRRRTERGKVVYRCATRIEKGREACKQSLTVGEEWIKEELRHRICGGEYDDEVIRKKIR